MTLNLRTKCCDSNKCPKETLRAHDGRPLPGLAVCGLSRSKVSHLQIGRQIFRDIHISGFGFPLLHPAGHRGNEDFVSHFLKIQTELEIFFRCWGSRN